MRRFQVASRGWHTWLLGAAIALVGCTGEAGPQGETGPQGEQGEQGEPGVSAGVLTGTVTATADGKPLAGIEAKLNPLGLTATTDAAGVYTIADVPAGVYTASFSGANVTTVDQTVSVVAGQTITLDVGMVFSPIGIAMPAPTVATSGGWKVYAPVGFGQTTSVEAAVTGASAGATYKWTMVSGPSDISADLTAANSATLQFTTCKLSECAAGGKVQGWNFAMPAYKGLVAVTAGQTAYFTYTLKLTVTDGAYKQTATIGVPVAAFTAGQKIAPVGVPLYATAGEEAVATGGWILAKPNGSNATLNLADDANPWFVPDVVGTYTLKNGDTDATPIVVVAGEWHGDTFERNATTGKYECGGCHTTSADGISEKYAAWQNSAHGNHFWKYMSYDADGNLVWTDTSVKAPTALVDASGKAILWANPGRMTVAQYGLSNAEGAHYGESCVQCHAVGQNPLVANNGFDDQTGYLWSKYSAEFHDTDLEGRPVSEPDPTAWNLVPAASQARAGIQCESCHGPLGQHLATFGSVPTRPTAMYDAETCGVCHDRAPHHDRYALWNMGGHANHELALSEGSGGCSQCHTAQGFAQWAAAGFAVGATITGPAAGEEPQPITCQACHDPHSTQLRIDESKPLLTEAGFTVAGAGPGQLCMTCHQSRRGIRNDSKVRTDFKASHQGPQADLFYGQNFYFFGPDPADGVALLDGSAMATHAVVLEGACVGCHMEPALASESLNGLAPRVTNHSFKVAENVCGDCHEGGSFEALKSHVEAGLEAIDEAALTKFNAAVSAGYQFTAIDPVTGASSTAAVVLPGTTVPDALKIADTHGNLALVLHYAAPISVTFSTGTVDMTEVELALSTLKDTAATPANIFGANSNFAKGMWNYLMLEADRSFGAHNPTWVTEILRVTQQNIGL